MERKRSTMATQQTVTYADHPDYDSYTAEGMTASFDDAVVALGERIDAIAASDEQATVEKVLLPLDDAIRLFKNVAEPAVFMGNVHPVQEVKEAGKSLEPRYEGVLADVWQHGGLYKKVAAVDLSDADADVQKLHADFMLNFRLTGADKPQGVRERIREIVERKTELGVEYQSALGENITLIAVENDAELLGLPDDFIKEFCKTDEGGVVTIKVIPPVYTKLMEYASDRGLRKRFLDAWLRRGYPENGERLRERLELSWEQAELLGFPTMAHAQFLRNMAHDPATVQAFIDGAVSATESPMARDLEQATALQEQDDPGAGGIEYWEVECYLAQVEERSYDVDPKVVRQYFTYPDMFQACFDMAEGMGLTFVEAPDVPAWHEDVVCYEVFDDGELRGRYFFDMFSRDGKLQHYACFTLNPPVEGKQLAEVALVCSFTKGDGTLGSQLLDGRESSTLLHEFGHGDHAFKANQRLACQAGTECEGDFGEAPSQMLENWLYDREFLRRYARHFETREPIPMELVERMKAAELFGEGYFIRRQLTLATLSLRLYLADPFTLDFGELFREAYGALMPFSYPDGAEMHCSWMHLIDDLYGPGYYGYMWAKGQEKLMLTALDQDNLMDPVAMRTYADKILAPGGSIRSLEAVRNLLGDPTIDEKDAARAFAESLK